jgi:hypothetical protein
MNEEPRRLYIISGAELLPRGDGSFVLKPGKPEQWLWTQDAAKAYGVSQKTIVRWWSKGFITGRRVGPRRIQIDAESLSMFCSKAPTCAGFASL